MKLSVGAEFPYIKINSLSTNMTSMLLSLIPKHAFLLEWFRICDTWTNFFMWNPDHFQIEFLWLLYGKWPILRLF